MDVKKTAAGIFSAAAASERPNRMLSYFQEEWKILFFVTVSGLIYNLGLLAGPWFEGKMTGNQKFQIVVQGRILEQ